MKTWTIPALVLAVTLGGCAAGNMLDLRSDDIEGTWRLDASRSDRGSRDVEGARAWRLPNVFHVTSDGSVVRIEDQSGALLQEIVIDNGSDRRSDRRARGRVTYGRWSGNDLVVAEAQYGRQRVSQTFSVDSRGERLVVHTERTNDRGDTRNFTWTYERG